jgi:hypothetical protein
MTAFVEEQGPKRLRLREVGHSIRWTHEARVEGVRGGRNDDGW